jgi:hypothetical protein
LLQAVAELILSAWREDGRFRLSPQGAIYPCHTVNAAAVLCHMGYDDDARLQRTFEHLLDIQHTDGGWRCNKFSFNRHFGAESALDRAVDFLLEHWTIKKPIGPCHYGIGSLFMQVEYPFRNYNLFVYVYVLSFYDRAKKDRRFLEALEALESRMVDGQIVVERVVPKLAGLSFCRKGQPSALATKRYGEIAKNLG